MKYSASELVLRAVLRVDVRGAVPWHDGSTCRLFRRQEFHGLGDEELFGEFAPRGVVAWCACRGIEKAIEKIHTANALLETGEQAWQ